MRSNKLNYYFRFRNRSVLGFTLIEVAVVATIIGVLSTILLLNFRSSSTNKTARNQTVSAIISNVRRAQTMTTSTSSLGANSCGFGIHYVSPSSYIIYRGAKESGNCSTSTRNYQAGVDTIIETITLLNINMNIKASFSDIFFEPPDPKTFVNGDSSLTATPATITVGKVGQSCGGGNCTNAVVRTSGSIDIIEN